MARLYADEDVPYALVEQLRSLGHDVVTVAELGRCSRPDEEVLADAMADDRVVLTHNRKHFVRLHRATPRHSGIISATRDDDNAGPLAARIHTALAAVPSMAGQHFRVNRPAASP